MIVVGPSRQCKTDTNGCSEVSISTLARKLLWGRAANHCSMDGCRKPLVHHVADGGRSPIVIGEEAHIVARSEDGPRGNSTLSAEQRDDYDNLILLCPNHHSLIDKAPEDYSVASLRAMKVAHELWVGESLGAVLDASQVKCAALVDDLTAKLQLENWTRNFSPFFSGGPASLPKDTDSKLRECLIWIATRPWPEGQSTLHKVVRTIGRLLDELLRVFDKRSELDNYDERLIFRSFYKISFWDEKLYNSLLADYKSEREYLADLAFELTRYVNMFIDTVRADLDPSFRETHGYVTLKIEGNPLQFNTYILRFTPEEILQMDLNVDVLKDFDTVRSSRRPRLQW